MDMSLSFSAGFVVNVFGVPVNIGWSAPTLFLLFIFDARCYIKEQWAESSKIQYLLAGAIGSGLVMASLALHELSHALAAYASGISIKEAAFSFWGAYVVPDRKFDEMTMLTGIFIAAAGPAMNYLLAGIATLVVWLYPESIAENTVQYAAYINIKLAKLNLLPIMILDGGKIVYSIFIAISPQLAPIGSIVVGIGTIVYLLRRKKPVRRMEEALGNL